MSLPKIFIITRTVFAGGFNFCFLLLSRNKIFRQECKTYQSHYHKTLVLIIDASAMSCTKIYILLQDEFKLK